MVSGFKFFKLPQGCEVIKIKIIQIPYVSLGMHFFNDIVETKMVYLAVFPYMGRNVINKIFFEQSTNKLKELLPNKSRWSEIVKVIDTVDLPD